MTIEVSVAISIACAIIGALIGYAGHKRTARNEAVAEGKNDGVVLTEIGYIKSGIDDIKRKQYKQESAHIDVIARLTAVEGSAKQAHKRIDTIEGRKRPE